MRRPVASYLAIGMLVLCVSSCGEPQRPRELRVFAASSLVDLFGELERDFEEEHADVDVRLVLAGSQVLRTQIDQGARADLFAPAHPRELQSLAGAGLIDGSREFARSELVLVASRECPKLRSFAELPECGRLVIGSPNAPIGRYAREILNSADELLGTGFAQRCLDAVVSEEPNVRRIRAKLQLGEADAGFLYRSDLRKASGLRVVELPKELRLKAVYRIALMDAADEPELARAWMRALEGPAGRARLKRHGFEGIR